MPTYRVKWEIDIDADSPLEAAQKAYAHQRNPHSELPTFDVGQHVIIVADTVPSPWRPASGHPGGWRVVRNNPSRAAVFEQLMTRGSERVRLFRSADAAKRVATLLNAGLPA